MARQMTPEAAALRAEVMAAVQAEVDQGRQPDRHAIARQFQGKVATTTALRWIDGALAAGNHNPATPEPDAGSLVEGHLVIVDAGPEGDVAADMQAAVMVAPPDLHAAPGDRPDGDCGWQESPASVVPETEGAIVVALSPAELERLDRWRSYRLERPSRAEAIRMLMLAGFRLPV
jgi:hypothetical protein